ncbi:MAG: pyridoxal phosphate-dependent aminotransferase family protein [Christensenellaceae bacterium]|mgnify:FL=1|jgi:8-amino-7-oxononanoate synthase|nr:pyridoxal phosphate-dependent aminotransferase family protein [Christensenellaceae bacterium]MDO4374968.1 pyridoxal phosphate-dependent aminotransferase family protein [Clostridia bacterium]MDY2747585.1 pyridoxal phosphate-dependent aminotransferase family protein [Eubacteriales bacterium]MCI6670886.1 pyridoxal phosphate-dependent aminotransferase family protein [Christensenellaceae bacterium]MDD6937596.1 pyridoxal phosphate-dependent aminotransferase family protein [Christensenellaceae bact
MPLFKKCEEYVYIRELVDKGIYPYFHELESKQDIEVMMEGKRRIMLGSNNYLGLTVNQEVIDAGVEAMKKYGTGCSGSRFLNGTLDLHNKLERELADFLGTEDCVTFSTGFQSNLGIISAICGRQDYIFNDRENHASIYDGCKLSYAKVTRYRHNDMADLEKRLAETPIDAGKLIVTDGVFSMSGDICRLPDIAELAHKYKARVMVDDAHGLGVIGKGGRGTASYFGLEKEVDITMGTFSKSLASLGGYMVASAKVCEYVRHNSRPFIFSASLTPASCATARAALKVIREHPEIVERLGDLAEYYRDGLAARGVPTVKAENKRIPIIPIYTYDAERTLLISKKLFEEGVYVNPVLPPATAPTECLLRTSLMATHTESVLDEAMDIIARVVLDD